MLPSNAHKNNQGFTMIEILTVVVIIGILSAIAAPSFLGMLNKNKLSNALAQVRGALQEAQREAINKSKTCEVTIPEGNDQTINSTPSDCLVTGSRTLKDINIEHVTGTGKIEFDFKGRTNVSSAGTIRLSVPDTSLTQKCLVVSEGLGIIRTGNYDEAAIPPTPKCQSAR